MMTVEFDIFGQRICAQAVQMRGRGMTAQFAPDVLGIVSKAMSNQRLIGISGMASSPLYEVQAIQDHGAQGCDVHLEIASSAGRSLH